MRGSIYANNSSTFKGFSEAVKYHNALHMYVEKRM